MRTSSRETPCSFEAQNALYIEDPHQIDDRKLHFIQTVKKDAPTLAFIHGKKDKLVPYENVPFMENQFSEVVSLKMITLENTSHFIVWNQFELVNTSILDWVQ